MFPLLSTIAMSAGVPFSADHHRWWSIYTPPRLALCWPGVPPFFRLSLSLFSDFPLYSIPRCHQPTTLYDVAFFFFGTSPAAVPFNFPLPYEDFTFQRPLPSFFLQVAPFSSHFARTFFSFFFWPPMSSSLSLNVFFPMSGCLELPLSLLTIKCPPY